MGLVQFLTFFVDDTTTIDGATIPLGTDPTEAQTSCGTNLSHARPAMMFHEQGIDRGFNVAEASVSIGAATFEVQDNRRSAGQGTGWFTYILATAGGVPALTGQRVVFQQKDDFSGSIYTVATLLVQDISLDDSTKTIYRISTRDFRERERSIRLFDIAANSVIWPYGDKVKNGTSGAGSRTGYGKFLSNAIIQFKLIPSSQGVKAKFKHNILDANAHTGAFILDVQPWIDGGTLLGSGSPASLSSLNPFDARNRIPQLKPNGSTWYDSFVAYNLISLGDTATAQTALTSYGSYATDRKLTGLTVEWRVWGTFGAWIPAGTIPEWVLFDSVGNRQISQLGFGATKTDIKDGAVRFQLGLIAISALTSGGLPTDNVDYEIRVLSGLPPAPGSPMYIEEPFGTFLKKAYDGNYSSAGIPVKYNAARMTELATSTPLLRAIITGSKDNGQDWLVENWYKPMGMFPYINPKGEIEPRSIDLPDPSVTVDTIDDSMVLPSTSWDLVTNDAVTQVDFTYLRDFMTPDRELASVQVHVDKLNVPATLAVGNKTVSFAPETVHDVSLSIDASFGNASTANELGYRLALKAQHRLLDRLAYGGQHCTVDASRSFSIVRNKQIGDWIIASISWLPDLATRQRGMYRLMQITDINESNAVFRRFICVDAGPAAQPLAVPTGVTITAAGVNVLSVDVTGLPTGASFAIYVAENTTEPAAGDGLWTLLGRHSGTGTYVSSNLNNTTLWVKVRSEQFGRRPSNYTTAVSVALSAVVAIVAPQLSMNASNHAIFSWTPTPGVLSLRLSFQVVLDSATPSSPLPVIATVDPTTSSSYDAGYVAPLYRGYGAVQASAGAGFTGAVSPLISLRSVLSNDTGTPSLDVRAVPGTTLYTIYWSGDNVELSINGATYGTPGASGGTVARPTTGNPNLLYTYRATRDGLYVTDSVTIAAIGSSTTTPDLDVVPSAPAATTQSFTATAIDPTATATPSLFAIVRGTTASVGGTNYADGTEAAITSGSTLVVNRPAINSTTIQASVTFRAVLPGGGTERIQRSIPNQVQTVFGPSLTVKAVVDNATPSNPYTIYWTGSSGVLLYINNVLSTLPATGFTVPRPAAGAAPLEYVFTVTADSQTLTDSVTILPVDRTAVSVDLNVVPAGLTPTTQYFGADATAVGGGTAPGLYVTLRGTTGITNGSVAVLDGVELLLSSTGASSGVTVNRPLAGATNPASISFRAIISGSGTERIQRSILPQTGAAQGQQILSNPNFAAGLAGYNIYDNNTTGKVTKSLVVSNLAKNASGQFMRINIAANSQVAPAVSPEMGGFYINIGPDSGSFTKDTYHRGSTIIFTVFANIPVGYKFNYASNAIGDQGLIYDASSMDGTGAIAEYRFIVVIGTTSGSAAFSTTGFFYLSATTGSGNAAIAVDVHSVSGNDISLTPTFGPSLSVKGVAGTPYTIYWSGPSGTTLHINGTLSTLPASGFSAPRPLAGGVPLEYVFTTPVLDGQTVSDSVTIQPIDKDTVTPDLVVTPGSVTDTTMEFGVSASNPDGIGTPSIFATVRGSSGTVGGTSYLDSTETLISSGATLLVTRPIFGTNLAASVTFRASITGAGSERIQRTVLNRVKTTFGPDLFVKGIPGNTAYTIYWSGTATVTLKINNVDATLPASGFSVPRPAVGGIDLVYTFTTPVVDGISLVDSVVVRAIGAPAPLAWIEGSNETDTTIDVTFYGSVGAGGTGLQWQYKYGPGAYSALSSTALPVTINLTRLPKATKNLFLRVIQDDGQYYSTLFGIEGANTGIDRSGGKVARTVSASDGNFTLAGNGSDSTGLTMNALSKESGLKYTNLLFAKLTPGQSDDLEYTPDGATFGRILIGSVNINNVPYWTAFLDNRNTAHSPSFYNANARGSFKDSTVVGFPGTGSYVGIFGWKSYIDNSDGNGSHELAGDSTGNLYYRHGQGSLSSDWSGWVSLLSATNASVSSTINSIVRRDGSGHIYGNYGFFSYFNSADDTGTTAPVSYVMAKKGDNYHRSASGQQIATFLNGTDAVFNTLGVNNLLTTAGHIAMVAAKGIYHTDTGAGYSEASLMLRESGLSGVAGTAPRLAFHWSGAVASQIGLESGGRIAILTNAGNAYESFAANDIKAYGSLITNGGLYNTNSGGIRVAMPGGAVRGAGAGTETGAFKIKLPVSQYLSATMLQFTVTIYQYATGTSHTFRVGGYNYNDGNWYNTFVEQHSDSGTPLYVRFGRDSTSNCIWIGETGSSWSYPQVFVTDFQGGFGGYGSGWATGWTVSLVTAFDTVGITRLGALGLNTTNYNTYVPTLTGTGANGNWNINAVNITAYSINQNLSTTSSPYFGSVGIQTGLAVLQLANDGVSPRLQSYASKTLYINQLGNPVNINAATTIASGDFSVSTGNVYVYTGKLYTSINNLGYGLTGAYDPTKVRAIYAMDNAYNLLANGTGLGNLYGLFYGYDDPGATYINLTSGRSLGHGLGVANVGTLNCFIGQNGFYHSGTGYFASSFGVGGTSNLATVNATYINATALTTTSNIQMAGALIGPGNGSSLIVSRNAANTGNIDVMYVNTSDVVILPRQLYVGGATTINGTLSSGQINTGTASIIGGDFYASRSANVGVIYLGTNGSHYLFFDGTVYNLYNGSLVLNAGGLTLTGNINLGTNPFITAATGYIVLNSTDGDVYLRANGTSRTLLINDNNTSALSINAGGGYTTIGGGMTVGGALSLSSTLSISGLLSLGSNLQMATAQAIYHTAAGTDYATAALMLRERSLGGTSAYEAPRLALHWGGVTASQITIEASGRIAIRDNPGTGYQNLIANTIEAANHVSNSVAGFTDSQGKKLHATVFSTVAPTTSDTAYEDDTLWIVTVA